MNALGRRGPLQFYLASQMLPEIGFGLPVLTSENALSRNCCRGAEQHHDPKPIQHDAADGRTLARVRQHGVSETVQLGTEDHQRAAAAELSFIFESVGCFDVAYFHVCVPYTTKTQKCQRKFEVSSALMLSQPIDGSFISKKHGQPEEGKFSQARVGYPSQRTVGHPSQCHQGIAKCDSLNVVQGFAELAIPRLERIIPCAPRLACQPMSFKNSPGPQGPVGLLIEMEAQRPAVFDLLVY